MDTTIRLTEAFNVWWILYKAKPYAVPPLNSMTQQYAYLPNIYPVEKKKKKKKTEEEI
jgi:hypothetical protein